MNIFRINEIEKEFGSNIKVALLRVANETTAEYEQQLKERNEKYMILKGSHDKAIERIETLEAKLKRYENPVAEFEGKAFKRSVYGFSIGESDLYIDDTHCTYFQEGKNYHVIVLEGGE